MALEFTIHLDSNSFLSMERILFFISSKCTYWFYRLLFRIQFDQIGSLTLYQNIIGIKLQTLSFRLESIACAFLNLNFYCQNISISSFQQEGCVMETLFPLVDQLQPPAFYTILFENNNVSSFSTLSVKLPRYNPFLFLVFLVCLGFWSVYRLFIDFLVLSTF